MFVAHSCTVLYWWWAKQRCFGQLPTLEAWVLIPEMSGGPVLLLSHNGQWPMEVICASQPWPAIMQVQPMCSLVPLDPPPLMLGLHLASGSHAAPTVRDCECDQVRPGQSIIFNVERWDKLKSVAAMHPSHQRRSRREILLNAISQAWMGTS